MTPQYPDTPPPDPEYCGALWILRAFAITVTAILFLIAFGLLGRLDRQAEAVTLQHNTCISAMVMAIDPDTNLPTTTSTPEICE